MASSTALPAVGEPLRAVASQLRDEFSSFDRLMSDVFADVEQLRDQLQQKIGEVDEARERLAERGRQLAEQRKESGRLTHQLEHQEARLDAAIQELRLLRQQSEQEQAAAKEREDRHQAAINAQLVAMNGERERLVARIKELESRPPEIHLPETFIANQGSGSSEESLLAVLSQLEAVRQDVLSTRTELADAVGRVSIATSEVDSSGISPQQLHDLQFQLEQLRQEQRTLEKSHDEVLRERDRLESELELVRTRACELQEVVAEQQDQLAQQHDDVSDELRSLKAVIENQLSSISRKSQPFDRISASVTQPPPQIPAYSQQQPAYSQQPVNPSPVSSSPANSVPPESAEPPPADPVMNSVMAQFARLQKDVAQRRKKK